jgi:hypothetical protein
LHINGKKVYKSAQTMTYPQINKEILQKFMVVTTAVMGIEVKRSKEENKKNVLAITSGAPPMTEK